MSSSSSTSSNSHLIKYIYEIPYLAQSQLCDIINKKECWEQLGGNIKISLCLFIPKIVIELLFLILLEKYMQFDRSSIQNLRKEKNPSEKLLNMWGSYNHTVVELLALFKKMKLYDCMLILKPHVSEEFHKFIPEQNNYNSVASTADIQKPEENKSNRQNEQNTKKSITIIDILKYLYNIFKTIFRTCKSEVQKRRVRNNFPSPKSALFRTSIRHRKLEQ